MGKTNKVLVVDDDPVNRSSARRILLAAGMEADVAADGLYGLEAMRSNEYGAVLSDVDMPVLDGPTMMEMALAEGVAREGSFVFMSGSDGLLPKNAVLLLRKPFSATEMTEAVRRALTAAEEVVRIRN